MHIFKRKSFMLALVVVSILAMLAIMTRSSLKTAGASTGSAIQKKKQQLAEAFRLAEGR